MTQRAWPLRKNDTTLSDLLQELPKRRLMLSLAFTWSCCTASVQSAVVTASVASARHYSKGDRLDLLRLILHCTTVTAIDGTPGLALHYSFGNRRHTRSRHSSKPWQDRKLGSAAQATSSAQLQLLLHCTATQHKREVRTAAQLQLILHCTTANHKRQAGLELLHSFG